MEKAHNNAARTAKPMVNPTLMGFSSGDLVSTLGRSKKVSELLRGGKRVVSKKPTLSQLDGEEAYLNLKPKD